MNQDIKTRIETQLIWMGFGGRRTIDDVDICEDGSVWCGLTQICPVGWIDARERDLEEKVSLDSPALELEILGPVATAQMA